MIENSSDRLADPGGPHENAPDKISCAAVAYAERSRGLEYPFHDGDSHRIGETWPERIDSLFAINEIQKEYGHIQR